MSLFALRGEPRDCDVAATRAQHWTVHWTGVDAPVVAVNWYGFRPFAAGQARDINVADLVPGPIAVGDDRTVRCYRCSRRATLADAVVDERLRGLRTVRIEHGASNRHAAGIHAF